MPARQFAISVTTSATVLDGTQYPYFLLINNGAAILYIGDSAVTTSTGFPVAAGASFTLPQKAHDSLRGKVADRLYGIVASSTLDVRVLLQSRPM